MLLGQSYAAIDLELVNSICKASTFVSAEGTEYLINLDCTLSSRIAPKEF